jgi:hypothetical protein
MDGEWTELLIRELSVKSSKAFGDVRLRDTVRCAIRPLELVLDPVTDTMLLLPHA